MGNNDTQGIHVVAKHKMKAAPIVSRPCVRLDQVCVFLVYLSNCKP